MLLAPKLLRGPSIPSDPTYSNTVQHPSQTALLSLTWGAARRQHGHLPPWHTSQLHQWPLSSLKPEASGFMHSVSCSFLRISWSVNLQCILVSQAPADRQNMWQQRLLKNESVFMIRNGKTGWELGDNFAIPAPPLVDEASFEDWLSPMLLLEKLLNL